MLKAKKRKETVLYKGYQKSIELQGKMPEKGLGGSRKLPKNIAVCSLKGGCGCSHFAYAAANCISSGKAKVYVVTKEPELYTDAMFHFGAREPDSPGKYQHIFYDYGEIEQLTEEEKQQLKRCDEKLMLCVTSSEYLSKLAHYVLRLEYTEDWMFLFNFTLEKQREGVALLMERYRNLCLPLFEREDVLTAREVVERIWG